jgi:hypothetical protein
MARTITEIRAEIVAGLEADPQTTGKFDLSSNRVSVIGAIIYVVAVAAWTVEKLMDYHKQEVESMLKKLKPHSPEYYREMALMYQHGDTLPYGSGTYDTVDADKQIIKHAVIEERGGVLRVKVAKDGPAALTLPEKEAFAAYMHRVKDAGVLLEIVSTTPDILWLVMEVYYDPLLLTDTGALIDGGTYPVTEAIQNYVNSLSFGGQFVPAHLIDAVQGVRGVVIPTITGCITAHGTNPPVVVGAWHTPESGYYWLQLGNIIYKPYV